MSRSYPLPWTNKMRGGMLATGIGVAFLTAGTLLIDAVQAPATATGFYITGAAAVVIGIAVFMRDFRTERKRRRHVKSKGHGVPKDWNPRIGVTAHRGPSADTFRDKQ
jgi:hypothetical protein